MPKNNLNGTEGPQFIINQQIYKANSSVRPSWAYTTSQTCKKSSKKSLIKPKN